MGIIQGITDLSNLKTTEEIIRFTSAFYNRLLVQLNGNLEFNKNIRSAGPYSVTFTLNTPTPVNHNLGVTPQGFLQINTDTVGLTLNNPGMTAYPWSATLIYLESNKTGVSTFYVI